MSVTYTGVGWNRHKRIYDAVLAGGVIAYLAAFFITGKGVSGEGDAVHDDAMLLIRGLGTCALLMLHVVLWIGPLCRLWPTMLPLLYNRRHLGVATFGVGAAHALLTIVQYQGFGNVSPIVSLVESNTRYGSLAGFPFEMLGAGALLILFLMAATSHDFWLSVLSARVWKWLHMGVYVAYALLILHVVLGALQQERSPILAGLLIAGVAVTAGLHAAAARRESRADRGREADAEHLLDAGSVAAIPMDRAAVICTRGGERIAVFKYAQPQTGRVVVSAVGNVCAHQQGPLGEGKVVDGCITCPWHGYQYRPGDGCAPPPFHEKIPTYRVTIRGERVMVDPRPNAAGTPVPPTMVDAGAAGRADAREFYTGYLPRSPRGVARVTRFAAAVALTLAGFVGAVVSAVQNPPAPSAWPAEAVVVTGRLMAEPYPMLVGVTPADVGSKERMGGAATALLVATGKFGLVDPADLCGPGERVEHLLSADLARRVAEIKALDGRLVRVSGTVLRREGRAAIEVADAPESLRPEDAESASEADIPTTEAIGTIVLRGEIVDPKCYFGAMKPGAGKTHKACAIRCVAGGIAPVLVIRDARGRWQYAVLTDGAGRPANGLVRGLVGEPVSVSGRLSRRGDVLFLAIDADGIERL